MSDFADSEMDRPVRQRRPAGAAGSSGRAGSTGKGRPARPSRPVRPRPAAMDQAADEAEQGDEGDEAGLAAGERPAPRRGAKRTLLGTIAQLPAYLRLFFGLVRDGRVGTIDKVLVGAAIAYVIAPIDFIPDWIPFLGQVDDVFLLVTALQRLIQNAGRRVVMDHWDGDPRELSAAALQTVIGSAAFFLPGKMRRRLRMIGRE